MHSVVVEAAVVVAEGERRNNAICLRHFEHNHSLKIGHT